ncbi:hypothetical protein, partial [Vibrio mediterranei]|uniref:hypothetical protein n=1 Tax=Vibrio mediterranei TaxID=689 RepID=UPI004068F54F
TSRNIPRNVHGCLNGEVSHFGLEFGSEDLFVIETECFFRKYRLLNILFKGDVQLMVIFLCGLMNIKIASILLSRSR